MEQNNELLESNSSFINAVDKMVYWSKLFGVLLWIAAIFTILTIIMVLDSDISFPTILLLIYILMVGLYIYSGNLFLRFSKTTRAGLNDQNKDALTEGFISMGRLFTFWGTVLCCFTLSLCSCVFCWVFRCSTNLIFVLTQLKIEATLRS